MDTQRAVIRVNVNIARQCDTEGRSMPN